MRAVAYCRVSTDTNDQLNSLETQKDFFEEYIKKSGDTLVNIYADEGVSGTGTKKRVQFQKLMHDAENGLFDILLVKDISRLARNTVDFLQCIRRLKALNIETYFLTANQTVLGHSEFILTIFSALAQEESANTSKRVKFGKKRNAKMGKVPNLVYGYDKIPGNYFEMLINDEESRTVSRIFNFYTKENYGTNKIAQILNNEGLKTKRGCLWTQHGVSGILKNPLYTGRVVNGKQEVSNFLTGTREDRDREDWYVVEKPEFRIIDDKTFKKAQKLFRDREDTFHNQNERHSDRHLYSTLIKCACCGKTFRRLSRKYQNTYNRWVCNTRNSNGKDSCVNSYTVDEDELTRAIREYFISILQEKDGVIKNIVDEFQKIHSKVEKDAPSEKALTAKLNKAQRSRTRYMDMYDDDLISRAELREKLSSLNEEIEICSRELEAIKNHITKDQQLEKTLESTFSDLETIISMEHMTNAQLKRIIEKIEVHKDGKIDVYLKLLSDIGLSKNVLVRDAHT